MDRINRYFNEKREHIGKIYDVKKDYLYQIDGDTITLFDKENKKIVMKAEYALIGIYNIFNSVWYWAWAINYVDRALAKKSEAVKEYGKKLVQEYKADPKEIEELYYVSQTGNFLTTANYIDNLVKLMLYVSGGIWYIALCNGKDRVTCTKVVKNDTIKNIEYLMITRILYFS